MKRLIRQIILLATFLFSPLVHSAEISEDFSARTYFSSGTAIWNTALGAIHPTLEIINYLNPGVATPLDVDVGDGSHGAFDNTTYARFSLNGDVSGNIIRLDTDTYPILKVTSFTLDQGWTLQPVGNNPLYIYSLSDIIIEGTINCSGANGEDGVNATPGAGGIGRCGGKNGGNGGAPTQAGENGEDAAITVTGGRGGNFTGGAAVGGGGGGSWNTVSSPGNGPNSAGLGGQAGTSVSEPDFSTLAGGSGGGGGSGTGTDAGAGGGGGGGLVILHAVRDFILGNSVNTAIGFILVNGGNGGSSNVLGGPGGGGAGGSLQVFAGRAIEMHNVDGGGAGQANFGNGGMVAGANGGSGRNWFSSQTYYTVGSFYQPAEQAPIDPVSARVVFKSESQNIVSTIFDLQSTRVTIDSLTTTPVASDFTLEAAGSSDNFVADDTGFTSDISLLKNKRYLRFRASISTADVNNPTMLDSISIVYSPVEVNSFEFDAAGCGSTHHQRPRPTTLIILLFPLALIIRLKLTLLKFIAN